MSRKILSNNLPYLLALLAKEKIEFRLTPKFEWEEFLFSQHTLDLFERCPNFRLVTSKTEDR